jgi:glutamate synthase domain-containing protein 1
MCGIVGLYLKTPALEPKLGQLFAPMLVEMSSRGPDSAGFAIYRDPVERGKVKLTLASDDPLLDWSEVAESLGTALGTKVSTEPIASHAVLITDAEERAVMRFLDRSYPEIRVVGAGQLVEIFKETGLPADVVRRFALTKAHGSHAIGHTRMATESAVTTAGSHPFSTGDDLCLVHNGSLSNHNRLRENLRREGVDFQTENDTEVAAGYLAWRMREGATLEEALEGCLEHLDGFYTFLVGTADGFAVLRDPIACKPAVIAETEDWVAMASEYRAIAVLPGASEARMWEPQPRVIYAWERALV